MNSDSAHSQELIAYVLGEMSAEEERIFEQEMEEDPVLASEVHEFKALYHSVAYTKPLIPAPEGGFNRVLEKLESGHTFSWRESFWALGGLAAGIAIAIGFSTGGFWSEQADNILAAENSAEVEGLSSDTESGRSTNDSSETIVYVPAPEELGAMTDSIATLEDENQRLRTTIIRITEEFEKAQRDASDLNAWRERYFDLDTGISRWSVLSLGQASNIPAGMTLTDYLEQLSATDPAIIEAGEFASVDAGVASTPPLVDNSQTDGSSSTNAMVLWDETGDEGILAVTGLPETPEGSNYQMWLVDESGLARSAGILPDFPEGTGQAAFALPETSANVGTVLITVEPTGGSESPTGATVLEGPIATAAE
ncbi:anti-sigma factor [Rubellicoccus peritrichatus]|uniref:Anti-sigma factor n=1 Tax=Rubellicoccus peritrichatus TaxID=3080537 RepID=A0AAQ3LIF2_9BACT|nr:anti-sigma factor [Puniceicoccus sp. CR14]WOO42664.1 anti-sigma factor [Puniceicoccus sp. CR14]